jgi:hypothetical protein
MFKIFLSLEYFYIYIVFCYTEPENGERYFVQVPCGFKKFGTLADTECCH